MKLVTYIVVAGMAVIFAASCVQAESVTLDSQIYTGGIDVPCKPVDFNEVEEKPMIVFDRETSVISRGISESAEEEEMFSASASMDAYIETSSRL